VEYAGLDQGLGAAVDDVWGWEGGLGDADVVYRGWDRLPGDTGYHLISLVIGGGCLWRNDKMLYKQFI